MEGGQQLSVGGGVGGSSAAVVAAAAPLMATRRQPNVDAGYFLPEPEDASREGRGWGGVEGGQQLSVTASVAASAARRKRRVCPPPAER
jgi:hypothetical protein